MSLKEDLLAYQPFNEQEEKDREVMLALLDTQPDIFERKNRVAHFTASAWLVNQAHDKVLMIYTTSTIPGPGPAAMRTEIKTFSMWL